MPVDGAGPRLRRLGPGRMARVAYRQEEFDAWGGQLSFGSTSECR
jgi:hypothetical protein